MSEENKGSDHTKVLEKINSRLDNIEHFQNQQVVGNTSVGQQHPLFQWPQVFQGGTFMEAAQRLRQEDCAQSSVDEEEDQQDTQDASGLNASVSAKMAQRPCGHPSISPATPFMYGGMTTGVQGVPTGLRFSAPLVQQFPPNFVPIYMVDAKGSVQGGDQCDYKSRFESVRSSVNRVVLDQDWLPPDSRAGISSADRELAAILARLGRFIETELKLMKEIQQVYHDEARVAELMDNLHLVQKSHMRYIQEEYNCLQLGGQYGQHMKTVFKQIRRNTTVYTPAFIEDVKTAISVTGA